MRNEGGGVEVYIKFDDVNAGANDLEVGEKLRMASQISMEHNAVLVGKKAYFVAASFSLRIGLRPRASN